MKRSAALSFQSFHPPRGLSPSASLRASPPPWRPAQILDEWVQRDARPTSLRQLTFFGRSLSEPRLLESANYVRLELPTRIAHRLRDMQSLPYIALTNPHLSQVYELYYKAFDAFRKVKEVKTVEDNERYCEVLRTMLREHLTVIPRLVSGVLEIQGLVKPDDTDKLMVTMLRSRISRRVIATQHLALTETFFSQNRRADSFLSGRKPRSSEDVVGRIVLKCSVHDTVQRCATMTLRLMQEALGNEVQLPEVILQGHENVTIPYVPSNLEYMIGELLRNSIQAVVDHHRHSLSPPPPIEVLICEADQHVIIRISDQGGGIPQEVLPTLWSFSRGPRREAQLSNLLKVPEMAATMEELKYTGGTLKEASIRKSSNSEPQSVTSQEKEQQIYHGSLSTLQGRPPDLRLGIGLPMSRVYAEYWAGSLEVHSLEGYGADAFLQISKLGNRNEQLATRANMDAV